jgi:cytochrome c553
VTRIKWIVFLLLVVSAVFLFIYTFRKTRPDIPSDEVHLSARRQSDVCLSCHGRNGDVPRSPNHPPGRECEQCHFWQGEAR